MATPEARVIARAQAMIAEARRSRDPRRWRVSPDIRNALLPVVTLVDGTAIGGLNSFTWGFPGQQRTDTYGETLLGVPIEVDRTLPPRSMVLE